MFFDKLVQLQLAFIHEERSKRYDRRMGKGDQGVYPVDLKDIMSRLNRYNGTRNLQFV